MCENCKKDSSEDAGAILEKMLAKVKRQKKIELIVGLFVGVITLAVSPRVIVDVIQDPTSYWNWFWLVVFVPMLWKRGK